MSYVDKIQIGSTAYDVQDTKTQQMIAGVYSTSGTYAVGDYVAYDGKLYRCVTAIDTAEAWTVAHWTEVTVGGDVADLKSAIDLFNDTASYTVQENYIVSASTGTISANTTNHPFAISNIKVLAGTTIKLKLKSVPSASGRGLCFYQANGSPTADATVYKYVVDQLEYIATVPSDSVSMALTVFGEAYAFELTVVNVNQIIDKFKLLAELNASAIKMLNHRVTSATDEYFDIDNVPLNTAIAYGVAGTGLPSNNGVLLTYSGSSVYYKVQIYVSSVSGSLFWRVYGNNSWKDWKTTATNDQIQELINRSDYYCNLSLFENVGVLGDSYASGACGENAGATVAVDHYSISWPQIMARRNGISVYNYTRGGASTRSFITDADRGLPKLLDDPAKDLYILVLERNDYNIETQGETGYLGSITDITGHSLGNYPDTFYGNYATIIENVITHAPNAKLVMMAGDYTSANVLGTAYNSAVVEIAEHYSLPYIEQLDDSYFSDSYYRTNWADGSHPSAIIYSGMEMAIERLFNRCVKDFKAYFTYYNG